MRLSYGDGGEIPEHEQDPSLLHGLDHPDLIRNDDGSIKHPKADMHWALAEIIYGLPREKMDPDEHRAVGKIGRFQSAYGASGATLERKIEEETGRKPEPGIGNKILEALEISQPAATAFLKMLEKVPETEGILRAASGRLRHFATHASRRSVANTEMAEERLLSAMGREARNFLMQTSVADTSARAGKWLLDHYIEHGMKARPMCILYDALVTLCPVEEAEEVERLHQRYMTDENTWTYYDTVMRYPIDTDRNLRWSTKLEESEKHLVGL